MKFPQINDLDLLSRSRGPNVLKAFKNLLLNNQDTLDDDIWPVACWDRML